MRCLGRLLCRRLIDNSLVDISFTSFRRRIATGIVAKHDAARNAFPDEPTSSYYDDLVNDAGSERDFSMVHHLLNKRVRDKCFNTSNTFKFIINTEESLSVLEDLTQALSRLDHGFPRKNACDCLIARLCKLDRTDEALRIVEIMNGGNYGLNALTFHPILKSLTRKGKMDDAWHILDMMRAAEASPDVASFNYLLLAYCYTGDLNSASRVMKKIEEDGLVADTRTYDALILGACRAEKVDGALVLLRRMSNVGVPTLYSTHSHIINALLKLGYYAQAIKFVKIYGGRDHKLDTENFGILASKLMNLGKMEEAKMVVEEMEQRGLATGAKLRDLRKNTDRGFNRSW